MSFSNRVIQEMEIVNILFAGRRKTVNAQNGELKRCNSVKLKDFAEMILPLSLSFTFNDI